ncbi:MAG: hypothetical protein WCE82_05645 [Halobacteriota archaeon]
MVHETIVESLKDVITVCSSIIESAEIDIAWLFPAPMLAMAAQYNLKSRGLMQKGGRVRGITTISSPYAETVSVLLDIGVDLRHIENDIGSFLLVGDKSQSISSTNFNVKDLSLDDKIVAFWTDDPDYAEYLLSNFDIAWAEATDAQKRIHEF